MPDITTLFEGTDGVSRTLFNQKLSDVNKHGNDGAMHVTDAEREKWNGKANGNNAVWVATETKVDENEPNNKWRLTIPNFVFTEGCQVTFKPPTTPSGTSWNAIVINNVNWGYALRTLSKTAIDPDSWGENATVTVNLSLVRIPIVADADAVSGTAFFKSGSGSIKEMFDFPLSIQTAEPTPVNTNHVWIMNDVKRNVTLDDAIRAYTGGGKDQYFAIVDSMDNNKMLYSSPKSLTNGDKTVLEINHHQQDTTPWVLNSWKSFAKKSGINFSSQTQSKWPRIMSRVNGVIDVENAKRWDGSAWQWLSQKGHYLLAPNLVMNHTEGILSNLRALSSNNAVAVGVSENGNYVCIRTRTYSSGNYLNSLDLYKRNGDSFIKVHTFLIDFNDNYYHWPILFSPDDQYLTIPRQRGIQILKIVNDKLTFIRNISFDNDDVYYGGCEWINGGNGIGILLSYMDGKPYENLLWTIARNGDVFDDEYSQIRTLTSNEIYSNIPSNIKIYGNRIVIGINGSGPSSKNMSFYTGFLSDTGLLSDTNVSGYVKDSSNIFELFNETILIHVYDNYSTSAKIHLVSLNNGTLIATIDCSNAVNSIILSKDKRFLFVSEANNTIEVFAITASSIQKKQQFSASTSNCMACW